MFLTFRSENKTKTKSSFDRETETDPFRGTFSCHCIVSSNDQDQSGLSLTDRSYPINIVSVSATEGGSNDFRPNSKSSLRATTLRWSGDTEVSKIKKKTSNPILVLLMAIGHRFPPKFRYIKNLFPKIHIHSEQPKLIPQK